MVIESKYHNNLETVKCWNTLFKVETPGDGKTVKAT